MQVVKFVYLLPVMLELIDKWLDMTLWLHPTAALQFEDGRDEVNFSFS